MKDKEDSDDENDNTGPQSDRQIENTAIITEFLQKLFPGCSIFSGRNDAFQVIASNHDYFKMFIGSDVTKSRTILFLDVVTIILSSIFADTIFFGIFYPSDSNCTVNSDEVSVSDWHFASFIELRLRLFRQLCVPPIIMNFVQLLSYVVELMIECLSSIDLPLCMQISHDIQYLTCLLLPYPFFADILPYASLEDCCWPIAMHVGSYCCDLFVDSSPFERVIHNHCIPLDPAA